MGALTWGLNALLIGTENAWSKLVSARPRFPGFGDARPPWLHGFTLYEASALLGSFAFGAIYFSLAYLTFVYRWPGTTAGQVRVSQD